MAVIWRSTFLFFIISWITMCSSVVVEVSHKNVSKIRENKPFTVFFLATRDCVKCRLLYPKFVAASRTFRYEKKILFGRIRDKKLAKEYEVTEFPSLIFFEQEGKHHMGYTGDITVDTIIEHVVRAQGGDFSSIKRHYTTDLDTSTFNEILTIPRQFKFLILYKRVENEDEVAKFDQIAEIFKNDDIIAFLRLDVVREPKLASKFEARQFPALYWYGDDEIPEKARYGAKLNNKEIVEFIKDHTGIHRTLDGQLDDQAGRLKDMDEFVSDRINLIIRAKNMDEMIKDAEKRASYHKQTQLAKYYVYLLKEIKKAKTADVLDDERTALNRALAEESGPKTKETLTKMKNIVLGFIDATGVQLFRDSKNSPFVDKREPRQVRLKADQEVIYRDGDDEVLMRGDGRTIKIKKKGKKKKSQQKKKEQIHRHEEL